jgi:CubicO group peptidase (beta-lactamase class C family)
MDRRPQRGRRVRRASRGTPLVALAGALSLVALACSGGGSPSDASGEGEGAGGASGSSTPAGEDGGGNGDVAFPGEEWARGDAAEAGFDPAALEEIATDAEQNGTNCLVVVRHGEIVAEWYWNGTDAGSAQEVFSATKSVTSTLVGIAQDDGDLSVDDPAADYIPEWAGTPSEEVTVENLVSNDSGREWSLAIDYQEMVGSADRTGFAVALGQDAPPGTTWAYNNSAIQTLDAVLHEATGEEPAAYADDRLLGPLGMTDSEMTRDPSGNTNMFFGLQSTCEDMARFGYLFLRDGSWDGEQIVSEEWVEAATGQPSQELNASYGYLWWLNHHGTMAGADQATTGEQAAQAEEGRMVEGAPEDMYWALGLGGQIVQVDPGSDTVVVRLGGGEGSANFGQAGTARVVTEALAEP